MLVRTALIPLVLACMALPARADDDYTRTVVGAGLGAAVGAALGGELGGRDQAILGGAIGGAVGAAIATGDRHEYRPRYRRARRYDAWDGRREEYHERSRWREREHRGASHYAPGWAMQNRRRR